jgi:hypothetical protein
MTRKDYQLIARALSVTRPIGLIYFDHVVTVMSNYLEVANKNFDREVFRKACYKEIEGGENEQAGET